MPNVGLVRLQDQETGDVVMLDTSSKRNRDQFAQLIRKQRQDSDTWFRSARLNPIYLQTGDDLVEPLLKYFHRREGHA